MEFDEEDEEQTIDERTHHNNVVDDDDDDDDDVENKNINKDDDEEKPVQLDLMKNIFGSSDEDTDDDKAPDESSQKKGKNGYLHGDDDDDGDNENHERKRTIMETHLKSNASGYGLEDDEEDLNINDLRKETRESRQGMFQVSGEDKGLGSYKEVKVDFPAHDMIGQVNHIHHFNVPVDVVHLEKQVFEKKNFVLDYGAFLEMYKQNAKKNQEELDMLKQKNSVDTTIRWKKIQGVNLDEQIKNIREKHTDEETIQKELTKLMYQSIESNARIVKWSNGTYQLLIGKESLNISMSDIALQNLHLYLNLGNYSYCYGKINKKMDVKASSNLHQQKLVQNVLKMKKETKGKPKRSISLTAGTQMLNSEKEAELLRQKEMMESKRRRRRNQQPFNANEVEMNADFLENDMSVLKKKFKRNKRTRQESRDQESEEEEEEEGYESMDDFIDQEDEEEDYEDTKPSRKKRKV